jgi:hypothetical protein
MKKGVVLFAHNSTSTNYFKMAIYVAKRVNQFLDLPVSVITDKDSYVHSDYSFDKVFLQTPDTTNYRKRQPWINKGRFQVFDMTPYDETLVLDTDYVINSSKLLQTFDYNSDFVCHNTCRFIFENIPPERIGKNGFISLWATVMRFRKTSRVQQIFEMMKMIQFNYEHYGALHKFDSGTFRNDYALTLALKVANGHLDRVEDFLHWNLLHVGLKVKVYKETDTDYVLIHHEKEKNSYIKLSNTDFHMLHKDNFLELIQ